MIYLMFWLIDDLKFKSLKKSCISSLFISQIEVYFRKFLISDRRICAGDRLFVENSIIEMR